MLDAPPSQKEPIPGRDEPHRKQIAERASAKAKEFVRSTGQLSGKVVVPACASNGSNYETLGMGIACGN